MVVGGWGVKVSGVKAEEVRDERLEGDSRRGFVRAEEEC